MDERPLITIGIVIFLAIPIVPAVLQNLRDDGGQFRFRGLFWTLTIVAVALYVIGTAVRCVSG